MKLLISHFKVKIIESFCLLIPVINRIKLIVDLIRIMKSILEFLFKFKFTLFDANIHFLYQIVKKIEREKNFIFKMQKFSLSLIIIILYIKLFVKLE